MRFRKGNTIVAVVVFICHLLNDMANAHGFGEFSNIILVLV